MMGFDVMPYFCATLLKYLNMKRIFLTLVTIAFVMAIASCASRRGVGCPSNPMNYSRR